MRVYVSGPMTGVPDHNRPAFDAAAKRLREQGNFVINPAELSSLFGSAEEISASFREYYRIVGDWVEDISERLLEVETTKYRTRVARAVMSADLAAVRSCDAIYLLRGWETSRGAKKELSEAIAHGLKVMQEGDEV